MEELVFRTVIEAADAAKTLGEVKQSIRDINTELDKVPVGSKAFGELTVALGKAKANMTDLREQVKALDPEKRFGAIAKLGSTIASGFAAAQEAVALFGSESEDLTKVLVRVQAAMALAQGLQGLAGFSKALETARLAMIAFAMSNPFTAIAAGVVALAAVIYGLVQAFDDSQEKADALRSSNEHLEESMKGIQEQTALTEREMKALGRTEEEIVKFRQSRRQIEIETIQEQLENINKLQRANQETTEDLKKRFELEERLKTLRRLSDIELLELEAKKNELNEIEYQKALNRIKDLDEIEKKDKLKKEQEQKEANQKAKQRREELAAEDQDFYNRYIRDVDIQNRLNEFERDKKTSEDERALAAEDADFFKRYILDVYNTNFDISEKEKLLAQQVRDKKIELAGNAIGVIGDLATAFAGENEKSAKRAFEINKAASIAQAIITTYQGANAIFASAAANPSTVLFPAQPFITAGIAIAAGLANVAKIAKTQFQSSSPDISGGGGASAPNLSSPQSNENVFNQQKGTKTNTDEQGDFTGFQNGGRQQQTVKAYVVESEVSDVQRTINRIENNSKF